jgi:ABC-type thiamine transport system ATPase subunit
VFVNIIGPILYFTSAGRRRDRASRRSPRIEARGLTKRFGSIVALDALDLDVPRGSIFGLLGPNGAGKTTTIRILTGLARASGGTAPWRGVDVGRRPARGPPRIGYLDQDPRFYGWMTGRELLELSGGLPGSTGAELRTRVDGRSSGRAGRRRRAPDRRLLAAACGSGSGSPRPSSTSRTLLILDEPVSSLDPEGRRDLLELIEELAGARPSSSRPTSSPTSSASATGSRSSTAAGSSRRARSPSCSRPTPGRSSELVPAPGQAPLVDDLAHSLRAAPWANGVDVAAGTIRVTVRTPPRPRREILRWSSSCGVRLAVVRAGPADARGRRSSSSSDRPRRRDSTARLPPAARGGEAVTGFASLCARSCSSSGGRSACRCRGGVLLVGLGRRCSPGSRRS